MKANEASLSDEGMILRGVVDVRKQKRRSRFDVSWMIWWAKVGSWGVRVRSDD
jgi:hypothetical protein